MALIKEAEYPLVIVAMEEIIEIRLKKAPAGKYARGKEGAKKRGKGNKGLDNT
ncbi:MAG: hypothetical protein LBL28_06575 [Treponema sp.]|jgi:hypothetical protein|nr:hypothetical protein [Treponema sp.]